MSQSHGGHGSLRRTWRSRKPVPGGFNIQHFPTVLLAAGAWRGAGEPFWKVTSEAGASDMTSGGTFPGGLNAGLGAGGEASGHRPRCPTAQPGTSKARHGCAAV